MIGLVRRKIILIFAGNRGARRWGHTGASKKRGSQMTGIELAASNITAPADAAGCFDLGMIYSAGAGVPVDMVAAHQWFNIAAMRGHKDAAALRREIAAQMSDSDIGRAQRAARDWLKDHPQAPMAEIAIRVAA
jgi:hypothetical protein